MYQEIMIKYCIGNNVYDNFDLLLICIIVSALMLMYSMESYC